MDRKISITVCPSCTSFVNTWPPSSWPVVGATFVLLHTTQDRPDDGTEILKFFDWAFKDGGQAAEALDYISLSDSVVTEIRSQ
ncbi:ABC-type phosphate transport system substrate-binding protein [Paraburkholderia sp. EB58]